MMNRAYLKVIILMQIIVNSVDFHVSMVFQSFISEDIPFILSGESLRCLYALNLVTSSVSPRGSLKFCVSNSISFRR